MHEGVFDAHPGGDGQAHAVVDVAGVQQGVRLPVVGAQRHAVGAVAEHGRDQGGEVARGGALPDEDPHAFAALLLGLLELGALVVGLDARGQVGVQLAAAQAGRVTVDALVAGGGDLGEHLRVAVRRRRESP